jgi:Holliday junction resolvase-like predicted endonuclease
MKPTTNTVRGSLGERHAAKWLRDQGYAIVELGRCDDPDGDPMQCPIILPDTKKIVSPDLLALGAGRVIGVEVKTKEQATWSVNRREFHVGLRERERARLEAIARWMPVYLFIWIERSSYEDLAHVGSGGYLAPLPASWQQISAPLLSHRHEETWYLRVAAMTHYTAATLDK